MATKAEERNALEQIIKIINSLGPDSYIGTAMDGMIEDAKENIENDFALSMKDRWMTAESRMDEINVDLGRAYEERDSARKELTLVKRTLSDESDRRNEIFKELQECRKISSERLDKVIELQAANAEQADEIIHLKAKLYDLMTK